MARPLMLLALGAAAVVGWAATPAGPADPPPDVVLVTIDTLRADALGCYGSRRAPTPVIDALAAEGTLFERAYCQVPMTPPSHASILTGTYPPTHGVRDFTSPGLRRGFPTLASHLKSAGYTTAAFVSAYVLDSVWGLDQGFDLYHDRFAPKDFVGVNPGNVQRRASETIDLALEWLRRNSRRPFFLWVHLFDPHHDYAAPEPYRSRYAKDPYAGEVAYTDRELGRLVGELKRAGRYASAAVIVTSDHGESFGEHGETEHGFFVYESTARIPLVIKLPASQRTAPGRVKEIVESVDIAPTVLQLAGVRASGSVPMEGAGLLSRMLGKRGADKAAYAETLYPRTTFGWAELAAYVQGRYKYIDAPRPELYDLAADPGENNNLVAANAAVASRLRLELAQLRSRFAASARPQAQADPARIEALRSLGYVAVASPARSGPGQAGRVDPKDKVAIFNKMLVALQASEAGSLERSNAVLEEIVATEPELFIAHYSLGLNRLKAGEGERALAHLAHARELNPSFDLIEINRATALAQTGRVDEAIAVLEEVLRRDPERLPARRQLALLLARKRDYARAIEIYRSILESRPDDALVARQLGIAEVDAQRYQEGAATLGRALELGGEDPVVQNYLGIALTNVGRLDEAIAAHRQSLALKPDYDQARLNLAFALLKAGKTEEAKREFSGLCRVNPRLCGQYRRYFP